MKIISHRGYWTHGHEKNTRQAFEKSFSLGYGIETDVRDLAGDLVISHDAPNGSEMRFSEMLDMAEIYGSPSNPITLALNIKADGLAVLLHENLRNRKGLDFFVFDMAVPDARGYLGLVPVFTRLSDVEPVAAWVDDSTGIWLDAFEDIWYQADFVESLLEKGKRVCVVSNELHRRPHQGQWEMLIPVAKNPNLILCTDFPEVAKEFFK